MERYRTPRCGVRAPFRRGTNRAAALSARCTRAGLSQRDNLYQQLRDAPPRRRAGFFKLSDGLLADATDGGA